jgi:hypothetical protein
MLRKQLEQTRFSKFLLICGGHWHDHATLIVIEVE